MSQPETDNPCPSTDPIPPDPDAATNSAPEATTSAAEPSPVLDPLGQALLDIDKWKDLAYRSQAELDNFRKRTSREAQEARTYANGELLRSLIPILDNFEMGLEAARVESESSMIFMGMQMVHRQFQDLLKDFGVQEVETLGKPFDPNIHDAVSQELAADQPEGSILRVTRRGYRLKDRLLRPASVIVSTAVPPTPQEAAQA
jgi:molecular chaperone GrpE